MSKVGIDRAEYPYFGYLEEARAELLRIGLTKCDRLREESQLCAVVFLLFRATSLFRSLLFLLQGGRIDACDVILRAYAEAWFLALEFRLRESASKAVLWHKGKSDSWKANMQRLEPFLKSQGVDPKLKGDYSGLSEVAHPTKRAATNSVVVMDTPLVGVSTEIAGAKAF